MATQAVYGKLGTAKLWKASGGDATFTPKAIANGAGRLGARMDLGALSSGRPVIYRPGGQTQCQGTPTVNSLIRVYLAYWEDDATPGEAWGNVGSTDAAFATENDLLNLDYIGNMVVRAAAADTIFTFKGREEVYIPFRYASVVWWNASGATLTNDDAEHWFRLTPVFPDIQAAA